MYSHIVCCAKVTNEIKKEKKKEKPQFRFIEQKSGKGQMGWILSRQTPVTGFSSPSADALVH